MSKSTQTTLPVSDLRIDPMNVRRHRGEIEPEFIASLEHHGVQQALLVRPNGKGHSVFAGGKRLEGLQALLGAKKIAPDYPVKVEIFAGLSDAEAREKSLVENFIRADMHPVDEYRGFLDVHTDKEKPIDAATIAARFGLDPLRVEQRLALGKLDDKILDAWLAGEIDEKTAQAFTLCPTKKSQTTIFKQLQDQGSVTAHGVRHNVGIGQDNPGRYLSLIGVEAYEARGGKVTRDLFGESHVVSDPKLVGTMIAEKIEQTRAALVADGWSFAVPTPENQYAYGSIQGKAPLPKDLAAQIKAVEKKLDALSDLDEQDFDAEDALQNELAALEAKAEPISYTKEQKAKAGCIVEIDHKGRLEITYGKVKPAEKKAVAASERKAAKGNTAASSSAPKPSEAKAVSNALAQRLEDQLTAATKKALKADTSPAGLPTILRELVAGMIGGYGMPHDVADALPRIRDAITPKVMNEAIRKEFKREDYFSNAPIPVLVAAITEAVNADEARKQKGKKKSEIAKWALANVGKTSWLPVELRTANYDGPVTKKAKAAPKGKAKPKKSK